MGESGLFPAQVEPTEGEVVEEVTGAVPLGTEGTEVDRLFELEEAPSQALQPVREQPEGAVLG